MEDSGAVQGANVLLTGAVILIFLALSAAIFRRFNVPMIILALAVGIFFGSDVTGIIYFDDALLTRRWNSRPTPPSR